MDKNKEKMKDQMLIEILDIDYYFNKKKITSN